MPKTRLEAFSDGVIAIILTIMVLELKVPKEQTLEAMGALWPVYAAYCLSYALVFLVWLNHHDTFEALERIDRSILVANGLLLFASSLVPFATAFAGEAHWRAPVPVATYGLVMVFVSLAFARLRTLAARCAGSPQAAASQRLEARKSLWYALVFLAGAAIGLFAPRLSLIAFALTVVIGMAFGRSRSRVEAE